MVNNIEVVHNDVIYKITCWTCCQIALKAAEDNFSDDVIAYNLEQMNVCENIHHNKR